MICKTSMNLSTRKKSFNFEKSDNIRSKKIKSSIDSKNSASSLCK